MKEVDTSASNRSLAFADWLVWGLVALAPFLFALASWNVSGPGDSPQIFLRSFSIPITAIEAIVVVFAILVDARPLAGFGQVPRWAVIVLAALVAIAIATAGFVANDRGTALVRTGAWIVHLLFGFSLWRLFRSRWSPLRRFVWPSAIAGVLFYIAVLIVLVMSIPNAQAFDWRQLWLAVTHVRQVGFYSVVGGAAALGLAATARSASHYWQAVAAGSVCLALSYWSGTRGSLIAVFVAFAAGIILLPALRSVRAFGALILANAAGALISLVDQVPHPFYGIFRISRSTGAAAAAAGADELTSGRLTMWSLGVKAVMKRPLLGFGESQFHTAVPTFGQFNHPHNVLLQVAISWGLVGLLCFVALAAALAWHSLIAARQGGDELVPPFLVAVGLASMAMYEGAFYHPYPVMMAATAIAFLLSSPACRRSS